MGRARTILFLMVLLLPGCASQKRVESAPAPKPVAAKAAQKDSPQDKEIYSVLEYRTEDEHTTVIIRYPQFNMPGLDMRIKDKAMQPLAGFRKTVEEEYLDADMEAEGANPHYELIVDFDVRMLTRDLLSLMFKQYIDYNGAHPTTSCASLAADMKTGEPITLQSLFKPGADYLAAISQATIAHFMDTLEDADADWVNTGGGPQPENYEVFYLQPYGVVFYFNPYQVTSYAQGPQEMHFFVLDDPMAGMMAPDMIEKLQQTH